VSSSCYKNGEREISIIIIKHFYLKKWTTAQIKTELDEVHEAPALKTVYFWINKFKTG